MTDTLTVRFNAPAHHELRVGSDLRIMGGETATLPKDEAEALAQNEAQVEIVDSPPVRGKAKKAADSEAESDTTKEDEL